MIYKISATQTQSLIIKRLNLVVIREYNNDIFTLYAPGYAPGFLSSDRYKIDNTVLSIENKTVDFDYIAHNYDIFCSIKKYAY